MNEVEGLGMPVVKGLPRILRAYAAACRRSGVRVGPELDSFSAKYFAHLAHCDVTDSGFAIRDDLGSPPPLPPSFSPPADGGDPAAGMAEMVNPYAAGGAPDAAAPDAAAAAAAAVEPPAPTTPPPAADDGDANAADDGDANAAATKIQAVQKGRMTRKQRPGSDRTYSDLMWEQKRRFLPGPRLVRGIRVEGGAPESAYDLSILDGPTADAAPFKVIFALRDAATGTVHAAELTEHTLPTVVPTTCTVQAFWKACATHEGGDEGLAFFPSGSPSPSLSVGVPCGRSERGTAEVPVCEVSADLAASYFEAPYAAA